MRRNITINPVTRIEGHASVTLSIDDSNTITASCFNVMDFRGFETILQGMQVEMMPLITARICGTCPHSHHLVAAKALDKIFGVAALPPAATLMRTLLSLAGFVHSHAIHLFALAGPDLLLGKESAPASRNIIGLVEKHPELAKKALRLRTIGARISEIVGGRGIHPVSMVAGGVATPLDATQLETLRLHAAEGLSLGKELYTYMKTIVLREHDMVERLTLPTAYLGTVNNGAADFYDGMLRLRTVEGTSFEFSSDAWASHIQEEVVPGSYGKKVYFSKGNESILFRVGPLARLNCADRFDTPLSQQEFEGYRRVFGPLCHDTVVYHYARLIELLYAVEKIALLVDDPQMGSTDVRASLGSPRRAAAHIEAPRGVLIHEYDVDANACVTKANLLVATQQNIEAINATITMSAQRYIDQPDEQLMNAIEFGIRCYDPCLSCATHRIGQMKMTVTVCHNGAVIRQVRR